VKARSNRLLKNIHPDLRLKGGGAFEQPEKNYFFNNLLKG
jgi:hypothetical protein